MLLSRRSAGQALTPQKQPTTDVHGYDYGHVETQPTTESLDLGMYARIREEGLNHSHIMEYASALFDDIGPRLTGSPNLAKANAWTRDQLTAMGCSNAHLESWGEFGMGWRQISTSIDMVTPDTAVFIGQATPWSPPTHGSVTAEVIAVPELKEEKDFDAWKGKLAGKIVLYGKPPEINPDPAPLLQHYDENKLAQIFQYPLDGNMEEQHVTPQDPKFWEDEFKKVHFKEQVAKFFAEQHAVALLVTGWGGGAGVCSATTIASRWERKFTGLTISSLFLQRCFPAKTGAGLAGCWRKRCRSRYP